MVRSELLQPSLKKLLVLFNQKIGGFDPLIGLTSIKSLARERTNVNNDTQGYDPNVGVAHKKLEVLVISFCVLRAIAGKKEVVVEACHHDHFVEYLQSKSQAHYVWSSVLVEYDVELLHQDGKLDLCPWVEFEDRWDQNKHNSSHYEQREEVDIRFASG